MIEGRDVSSHQGNYELEPGIDFIFIKATEDREYVNPWLSAVTAKARRAGLVTGFYHFLHPKRVKEQAAHFVKTAAAQPGELLVCDWEAVKNVGQATVAEAMAFMAEVKRLAPRNKVGLYCTTSDWKNTAVKANDFLWIADIDEPAGKTKTKGWMIHQYSWKPLDKNVATFRTRAEMQKWASSKPAPAPEFPPPAQPWEFRETDTHSVYGPYGFWQGVRVNRRTYEAVSKAAQLSGWGRVNLSQGGLSGSVSASAKTHMGLDCGDIMVNGHSKAEVWAFCSRLMECGAFPFPRGYTNDSFQNMKHIHFGMINADWTHQQMKAQFVAYQRGRDGLRNNRAYTGPTRKKLTTWARSKHNHRNRPRVLVVDPGQVKEFLYGIKSKGVLVSPLLPGAEVDAKKFVWESISLDGKNHKYAVTAAGVRYNYDFLNERETA